MTGFVASAQMLHQFLETIDWTEPLFADLPHSSLRLDIENSQQLQAIAQQLRQAIEAPALPDGWLAELDTIVQQLHAPVVVLRPSLFVKATASTAANLGPIADGSSSTLFDLQICRATETDVAQGLKRLWAQLFRAKSLFYWQRLGIHLQQVKLAVLVQPLRSAIASGSVQVLEQTFQIHSTNGLGMPIVWGEVLPDMYQAEATSGIVQKQQLGKRTIVYQVKEPIATPQQPTDATVSMAEAALTHHLTPVSHPHALPLLQAYLPDESQRARFSLNDQHISALIQLVQRVVVEFSHVSAVEWTLYAETEDALAPFCLTQVMTSSQARSQPLPLALQTPVTVIIRPDQRPHQPSQTALSELATAATALTNAASVLLVSGLAAAQGRSIGQARVISRLQDTIDTIADGTILVAEMLPPQWLKHIQQAAGIVLEQGSMTSHSAIIAREVGVPAVLAATNATHHIRTGETIMIDGDHGHVYRLAGKPDPVPNPLAPAKRTVSINYPPLKTRLMVNLSQPDHLESIAALPIDGIGLLRGEMMALPVLDYLHPLKWLQSGRSAALIERLANRISQFAAALAPRPVFYRSLDLRSHESRGLSGGETIAPEINPTLGLHGTFSYCLDPTLFDLELAALSQVQTAYSNIHLLLPFIRTVEEFSFCHQRVQKTGLTTHSEFQLWIMAEVPSVLFLLPDYVRAGVQGIAIGTNDLTQLLFGVDRDHGVMASAFDARHPAVKAAIAQLIRQASQAGIPASICGQAPSRDPELVEALVRWGIASISVDPGSVEATYAAIARAERQLLLEADLKQ